MKKTVIMVALLLSACASHTHEIPAAYVSPLEYDGYSCKQLRAEIARVSRRANEVAFDVNKNADNDSTATAVGLILFWPSLFFIDGDSPQAQEYARLKGQFEALEEAGAKQKCGIVIEESPFQKIEAERRAKQEATQKQHNQKNQ